MLPLVLQIWGGGFFFIRGNEAESSNGKDIFLTKLKPMYALKKIMGLNTSSFSSESK